ncbi:hypothetical protein CVT25_004977 [Psilocybe cyanescens]|uniref:Uncharacterized protein n=1 Tax=Psilocybe cyanescens TaxID=93625 RepID=A0A409XU96_PSICY|nr:hypothetical protein CVT25_004977 [Psilocybe cyanescens]
MQIDEDSDISSVSSLSTQSSLFSLSSFGSGSEAGEIPLDAAHAQSTNSDSEDKENILYIKRLAAIHKHIQYLEKNHILQPKKVQILSQLALVLVAFKDGDPEQFWCNLHELGHTAQYCPFKCDALGRGDQHDYDNPMDNSGIANNTGEPYGY